MSPVVASLILVIGILISIFLFNHCKKEYTYLKENERGGQFSKRKKIQQFFIFLVVSCFFFCFFLLSLIFSVYYGYAFSENCYYVDENGKVYYEYNDVNYKWEWELTEKELFVKKNCYSVSFSQTHRVPVPIFYFGKLEKVLYVETFVIRTDSSLQKFHDKTCKKNYDWNVHYSEYLEDKNLVIKSIISNTVNNTIQGKPDVLRSFTDHKDKDQQKLCSETIKKMVNPELETVGLYLQSVKFINL